LVYWLGRERGKSGESSVELLQCLEERR
jgi:hypothetical protein